MEQDSGVRDLFAHKVPFALERKYDVICAMDFLEHVENDQQVFDWISDHLAENGVLFVTVPAFQFLFSSHDVALEHFRRYRLGQLVSLNGKQLSLIKKGYFNFLLFPLVVASRILGKLKPGTSDGSIQKKQSSSVHPWLDRLFFSILRFEVRLMARLPLYPFGLTAFALFRK